VQSLRNYRLLCPSATFFRDGHVCEDCLGKAVPLPGVVHACYRESRPQSSVVASMITFHRLRRTWQRDVDRFVALTTFSRDKFVEGGLPPERIVVKPNSVDIPFNGAKGEANGFLFVGRLSEEKGVRTLLSSWRDLSDLQLTVIGDGQLRDQVRDVANRNPDLKMRGRVSSNQTYAHMRAAQALIFPSEWYETFGRVAIEAFAQRTPVIAARIGAIAEVVRDGETGLHFAPGSAEDLAAKVRWAADHPDEMRRMGDNARREYEEKYTPERNYAMLMDIYHQAIDHARSRTAN
jgi:glycosyltransferase involved in cell wall biosynthesis